jgi:hypothetical protein
MSDWIVNVKGGPRSWEISVVKADNTHGIRSYGWYGEDKILVSALDGHSPKLAPNLRSSLIEVAEKLAHELNSPLNKALT